MIKAECGVRAKRLGATACNSRSCTPPWPPRLTTVVVPTLQACVLYASSSQLADVQLSDAWWASATCLKAGSIWAGSSLARLSSGPNGWYACQRYSSGRPASSPIAAAVGDSGEAALQARVDLPGEGAWTPLNGLPAADMAACAESCSANSTCQAAFLLGGRCFTRTVR